MSVLKMGLVCYPESISQKIEYLINDLIAKGNVSAYAYILHDNDYEINGELKKPHYHVYLEFKKQQNPKTICKHFSIDEACSITVNNRDGYLAYFIHKYYPDKTQYPSSSVVVSGLDYEASLDRCDNFKTQDDPIKLMFDMRFSGTGMRELLNFALDYGFLDIYRRYYTILKECVFLD